MEQKNEPRKPGRLALQVLAIALAVVTLVLPMALAAMRPAKITAMLAFALIFQNIMTGSAGLPFYRIFKPKLVQRYHIVTGVLGFSLSVAHMVLLLLSTSLSYYSKAWIIGPVALALLAVTITTALNRRRLPRVWRRIHQVNYVIFVLVLVKAFLIGSNVRSMTSLKVVFALYAAAAACGLAYRLFRYGRSRARKAAAA